MSYTNPGWVNGGPPAINAANLNALCGAVERLDSGGTVRMYYSKIQASDWNATQALTAFVTQIPSGMNLNKEDILMITPLWGDRASCDYWYNYGVRPYGYTFGFEFRIPQDVPVPSQDINILIFTIPHVS